MCLCQSPRTGHYPQMLKLTDDLTATWLLELWLRAPTPAKVARLRVSADITEGGPNRNRRTEALSRGGTGSSNPLPSTGESKTNPSRPPRCGASKSIVLIAVLSAVPRDRLAWLNGRTRASSAASCPAGLADNYIISTRWACPPKSNVPLTATRKTPRAPPPGSAPRRTRAFDQRV